MAAKFTRNMYQTYRNVPYLWDGKCHQIQALVCFKTGWLLWGTILAFRDKITEKVLQTQKVFADKGRGHKLHDANSLYQFWKRENDNAANNFFSKKRQLSGSDFWGFTFLEVIEWLLEIIKCLFSRNARKERKAYFKEYSTYFKEYNKEAEDLSLLCFALVTCDDFPWIEVHSDLHSEDELSELIEDVAYELGIEMTKNPNLPSPLEIGFSNRLFDL